MRASFAKSSRLIFLFVLGLLAACAKPPVNDREALADFRATNDPLEPTNRFLYAVNEKLDTSIVRPVARAYGAALPQPARNGIHNVLDNLGAPVRLVNDMLEGKPRRAGDTAMRFVINSTVGVLGIFDVATGWGFPNHEAGFGLTLALWDTAEGPYLFLPFLGPSNPRDTLGFTVDVASNPFSWVGQGVAVEALEWSRVPIGGIDERQRNDNFLQTTKQTALDPYATFRSLYRQHRRAEVQKIRDDQRATVPVWFPQPSASSNGR
jgi:phospholipid-binding lipoprotein MlaA